MNQFYCAHKSRDHTVVCPHVFDRSASEGIRKFTGVGTEVEFICHSCEQNANFEQHHLCDACVVEIESEGDWSITGMPAILRRPRAFSFSNRSIHIKQLADCTVRAFAPLFNSPAEALVFTSAGHLLCVDLRNASARLIAEYDNDIIRRTGRISLKVSANDRFAAITSLVYRNLEEPTGNTGIVVELTSGQVVLPLDCGDYHTEEAEFPVTFIEQGGNTLVVHATDWNQLDITDLHTGKCITQRDSNNIPEHDDDKTIHTEWAGELQVSPDQRLIATIGWVWHPLGVAFGWDLQRWLTDNIWESDIGESKKNYAVWDYFWDSPFFWLDNNRLCIWGYAEWHTDSDIPLPSVSIYDGRTEQLLMSFPGPTMDVFYYDTYLFSGNEAGDGITIWSLDDGALLYEQTGIDVMAYHPGTKEFLTFAENGNLVLHHWQEGDGPA